MSEPVRAESFGLGAISRLLRALLYLRAALTPFRADLQALAGTATEDVHPSLLLLWRPCQERIDQLLDVAPEGAAWALQVRLLGQEMADNLIDETHDLAALLELTQALEEATEVGLLEVEQDLEAAVRGLEFEGGAHESGV